MSRRYGINNDDRESMLSEQRGICAICGYEDNPRHPLAIQHNHATGEVESLLCNYCNSAIGFLQNCPNRAEAVAHYLKELGYGES